jgi:hypothetical protein
MGFNTGSALSTWLDQMETEKSSPLSFLGVISHAHEDASLGLE